MKDILKTVLILSLIGIIAGALLGIVNSFTQVDPDEQLRTKLSLVYDNPDELTRVQLVDNPDITPITDEEIKAFGSVLDVFVANDGTYVFRSLGKGGYGGDIEVLIAIKDGYIVKIAPFKHTETPGLGSKGFAADYLSRYYNKDITKIDRFTITKNNPATDSDIKAVSGATYTSNAIANVVNVTAYWYNLNAPEGGENE